MEELILPDYDLDALPDIYADIFCAEILSLEEDTVFEYNDCQEFVITLSDNTVCDIYSKKLFHHRDVYSAYTIISIKDNQKNIFFQKKGAKILHIKAKIYALKESEKSPLELNRSYTPMKIKIDVMTPADYEYYFPSIKDVIIGIANHLESKNVINEIVRRQLENILIMLLSINLSIINTTLSSISGIALTNIASLCNQTFELSVSNVCIWSDNPETHTDARLLQTNNTQNKYVEIPRKPDEYVYEYREMSPEINGSCGNFTVNRNDDFKLWLFPNVNNNPLYLTKDKYNAVVTLKLKCNQTCDLLLHLYSIPNYYSVSYPLTVLKPNVWQSFLIPIINSGSSNIFHPLVVRAINYIKNNYGAKLTIEKIADNVHIHPSYLSTIFKKYTGLSVNNYINNYRISIAKQLLANTDNDISAIANLTGFYDSQHFLKTFKKVCGTTPKSFRKSFTV